MIAQGSITPWLNKSRCQCHDTSGGRLHLKRCLFGSGFTTAQSHWYEWGAWCACSVTARAIMLEQSCVMHEIAIHRGISLTVRLLSSAKYTGKLHRIKLLYSILKTISLSWKGISLTLKLLSFDKYTRETT